MTLQIIIEDGSGMADAESYIDADFMRQYAAKRGQSLPVSDDDLIPLMIRAMDYLESFATKFIGTPTVSTQALSWPRSDNSPNVNYYDPAYPLGLPSYVPTTDEVTIDPAVVPDNIKKAQAACVLILNSGVELQPVESGQFIVSEKIGPLETKYSENRSLGQPALPQVDAFLEPYLKSGGFSLVTVRA